MALSTNFVILYSAKSGGTKLGINLDKMLSVTCHRDVFSPAGQFFSIYFQPPFWRITQRDDQPNLYMDYLFTAPYPLDNIAGGFRLKFADNPDAETALYSRTTTKVILFERKDKLRRYIGDLIYSQISTGAITEGTEYSFPNIQLTLNTTNMIADFDDDRDKFVAARAALTTGGVTFMNVYYEDYYGAGAAATKASILSFLGLPASPSIPEVYAGYPTMDLKDIILNYEDVYNAVQSSEYVGDIPMDPPTTP